MDLGDATGGTLADEFLMDFDEDNAAVAAAADAAAAAAAEDGGRVEAMEQDDEVSVACAGNARPRRR